MTFGDGAIVVVVDGCAIVVVAVSVGGGVDRLGVGGCRGSRRGRGTAVFIAAVAVVVVAVRDPASSATHGRGLTVSNYAIVVVVVVAGHAIVTIIGASW